MQDIQPTAGHSILPWARQTQQSINGGRIRAGWGLIGKTTPMGGTTLSVDQNLFSRPSLYVYVSKDGSGDDQISLTAGNIQIFGGYLMAIAKQDISPDDGDKIYLKYNADWTWTLTSDADYPTDCFYIALYDDVAVTDDSSGVSITLVDTSYKYFGGDIILDGVFPVTVTGSGDPPTYSVTNINGIDFLTDKTPDNYRESAFHYTAGTKGVAYFNPSDGSFSFYVFDEYINLIDQDIVVDISWDGTTLKQSKLSCKIADQSNTAVDSTIDTPAPSKVTAC